MDILELMAGCLRIFNIRSGNKCHPHCGKTKYLTFILL